MFSSQVQLRTHLCQEVDLHARIRLDNIHDVLLTKRSEQVFDERTDERVGSNRRSIDYHQLEAVTSDSSPFRILSASLTSRA